VLYPHGIKDNDENILIFLKQVGGPKVRVSHEVSIIDPDSEETWKAEAVDEDWFEEKDKPEAYWRSGHCDTIRELKKEASHWMPDGNLTLMCEVPYWYR